MLPFEKKALGIAGLAAGGAYLGFRHLDQDADAGDRLKAGALMGVAAPFAAVGLYKSGVLKPLASTKLWSGAGRTAWTAAKMPVQAAKGIYNAPKIAQAGLAAVAAAGLYALGSHLSTKGSEAAAVENESGGIDYVDPSSLPRNPRKHGVSQRMQSIDASGDLVLGAHRGRH